MYKEGYIHLIITIPEEFITNCQSKFDKKYQIDILVEECAELIKALSKYKRSNNICDIQTRKEIIRNISEEITHVAISSEIVARQLKISNDDIQHQISLKKKEI